MAKRKAQESTEETKRKGGSGKRALLESAISGMNIPNDVETEFALQWCYTITRAELVFEGKTVSPAAKKAWFDHYGETFAAAVANGHHFKDDVFDLSARSAYLGMRAAHYAGADSVISEAAAKLAIQDVTCPKGLGVLAFWCAARKGAPVARRSAP